MYFFTVIVN